MRLLYSLTAAIATITQFAMATDEAVPPKLTLLYRMEAALADGIPIPDIPGGQTRTIIPIIGGTFKGPRLSGELFNMSFNCEGLREEEEEAQHMTSSSQQF